jgi:hypothetical protein
MTHVVRVIPDIVHKVNYGSKFIYLFACDKYDYFKTSVYGKMK